MKLDDDLIRFQFLDPGTLIDGDLELRLYKSEIDCKGEEPTPTYRFILFGPKQDVGIGFIHLRISHSDNILLYRGQIGYLVEPEYRGHGYAARACRLVLPLAKLHGLDPLWITCNPDNAASRKSCERAGAIFVETVTVPENTEAYRAGAREKCRYRLDLVTYTHDPQILGHGYFAGLVKTSK